MSMKVSLGYHTYLVRVFNLFFIIESTLDKAYQGEATTVGTDVILISCKNQMEKKRDNLRIKQK